MFSFSKQIYMHIHYRKVLNCILFIHIRCFFNRNSGDQGLTSWNNYSSSDPFNGSLPSMLQVVLITLQK